MKEEYADSCELSVDARENGLRVLARIIARAHIKKCLGAGSRKLDIDNGLGDEKYLPLIDRDCDDQKDLS